LSSAAAAHRAHSQLSNLKTRKGEREKDVLNNIKVEESHEKPKGAVLISTFLLLNLNKYQCIGSGMIFTFGFSRGPE